MAMTASRPVAARSQVSAGWWGWGLWGRPSGLALAESSRPDPARDVEVTLDGKKVLVCQGKPIPMPAYKDSSFFQSEYLIYQESQCRIRYLVQLHF